MAKYLDLSGLEYFWGKIKTHVTTAIADGKFVSYDTQSLTSAQKETARKNIAAGGSNQNLLDNWWWGVSGLINQRGVTSGNIVTNQHIIDRWYTSGSGSWEIKSSGIQFTVPAGAATAGLINQKLLAVNYLDGKKLTASVLMGDGTTIYSGTITRHVGTLQHFYNVEDDPIVITFHQDDMFQIRTRIGATQIIRAVKLELGEVSTLANDSYPNKAEELAKCQYYFERVKAPSSQNNSIAMGFGNGTSVYAPMMIHPKRTTPTLTLTGAVYIGKNVGSTAASAVSLYTMSPDTGHCTLKVDASNTSGDPYRVLLNSGGYIDFSADL